MSLSNFFKVSLLGLAFFVSACGETKPATVLSDDDQVVLQTLGRYEWTEDDRQRSGWPGSGTEFAFNGTRATIDITDGGQGIMDLEVNGKSRLLRLKPGTQDYGLVESDTPQDFHIRLTRRTEFYDTGFYELGIPELVGDYTAFDPAIRKILFLGDSITAGYGVGGDTRSCANTPALHSPTQSYAMLSADGLKAEPQLIAISGRGVVHNWDGNPAPVMPAQLDYALPDNPETKWDHAQFMPDVIVTLLGTNDWSVINPGQDKFRAGYRDMLAGLRERFPDAHIVTVSGPLLDGDKGAAIRDGIDWAMSDLNDSSISTLDLKLAEFGFKWSCSGHPGRTSMKLMANDLMAHIETNMGWDYTPVGLPPAISAPDILPEAGQAYFARRVAEIDELPPLNGGTLLIGDSITEGWQSNAVRAALLPGNTANHGVSWDTASGTLNRLPQILANKPDLIFIKIGTNDLSFERPPAAIVADVKTLIEALQAGNPNATLYLQSVLPREVAQRDSITELNRFYARLAATADIGYIDLTPRFSAEDGTLRSDLTEDGLHLTDAGYRVWAEALEPYLNR